MKRLVYVLLFILCDLFKVSAQQGVWTQKAAFGGTARWGGVGFSIGNKGYIGTGTDNNNNYFKDFWEYDQVTDTWTQKASFGGTARQQAVGFSIGDKGYIGTGLNGNGRQADFWEYDPVSNTWTQRADFIGTPRNSAVGFSIGNKGYIGTGRDDDGRTSDFYEFDPATNEWAQKADFGGGNRSGAVGFSIAGKGYIGIGYDGSSLKVDFWEYDISADKWTQKADFAGSSRDAAVGFSIGDKGYIGTGDHGNTLPGDFWEYDPSSNAWTQKAGYGGTVRWGAVGFGIGDFGYIGIGTDGSNNYYTDFWEFDPNPLTPDANNIIYVKAGATGNGSSWTNAAGNLQRAIDASGVRQVWVGAGQFQPVSGTSFSMKHGVNIFGHFAGTETALDQRDMGTADTTFLVGNGTSVIRNDDNGLTLADTLDGFTIKDGNAVDGGGIYNSNSSPALSNLFIGGNTASGNGGGIYNSSSSSVVLLNVLISGNSAANGGGIFNDGSSLTLINSTIGGNSAVTGGGIDNENSSTLVLNNSIVLGNNSGIAGTIDASSSHNLIQTGDETSGGNADGTGEALDKTTPGEVFTSPQDPGSAPTSDGDYSLKANTATVNAGENSLYPGLNADTKDLAGNPRVYNFGIEDDGIIDLGAYETQLSATPLKLISFNAEKGKTVVYLNWSTATEDNVNYFEVERSTDGSTFHAIGRVKATGNSNITQDYKFTDDAPADGNNFYRLKMVDLDGSASYSSVVNVRFRVSQVWTLSPNPATSYIMLQTSGAVNARTPVTITSAGGVMLGEYYMSTGSQTLKINISQLPAGTYYLRIISQDAGETVPFVKK